MKQRRSLGHRRALAKIKRIQGAACPSCRPTSSSRRYRVNHVRYLVDEVWSSVLDEPHDDDKQRAIEDAITEAINQTERAYQQAIRHVVPDAWTQNEIIRSAVSTDTSGEDGHGEPVKGASVLNDMQGKVKQGESTPRRVIR